LDHPNIVRLYETFETPTVIYLVMELLSGGHLLEGLLQVGGQLTEALACRTIQEILSSVRYCHNHNIVHRDLKLENFVFESDMTNAALKMIDFGLSAHITVGEILKEPLGSAYYVAPEVLMKRYNEKCDIWSIGVIAYMLLTGVPPFDGKRDADILKAVRVGVVSYSQEVFGSVSETAVDFIRSCLTYDPENRPSAEEAQRHPWFSSLASDKMQQPLPSKILNRLQKFHQKFSLTRLCLEAVAYALTTEELTNLRAEFDKFDTNSTGTISLEALRRVFEANGSLSDDEISEIFRGIDFEGTGTISYHELIAAMLVKHSQNIEDLKLAFDRMAHHKDYITFQDIRDVLGKDYTDEDTERMLTEMNYDRDAEITFSDVSE
jgi:calcium-dependent protein kinase